MSRATRANSLVAPHPVCCRSLLLSPLITSLPFRTAVLCGGRCRCRWRSGHDGQSGGRGQGPVDGPGGWRCCHAGWLRMSDDRLRLSGGAAVQLVRPYAAAYGGVGCCSTTWRLEGSERCGGGGGADGGTTSCTAGWWGMRALRTVLLVYVGFSATVARSPVRSFLVLGCERVNYFLTFSFRASPLSFFFSFWCRIPCSLRALRSPTGSRTNATLPPAAPRRLLGVLPCSTICGPTTR